MLTHLIIAEVTILVVAASLTQDLQGEVFPMHTFNILGSRQSHYRTALPLMATPYGKGTRRELRGSHPAAAEDQSIVHLRRKMSRVWVTR